MYVTGFCASIEIRQQHSAEDKNIVWFVDFITHIAYMSHTMGMPR